MSIINHTLPLEMMDPSRIRNAKPRMNGITMVMDKGIGLNEYVDMLQLSSSFIDYIKLGFGTCMLYPKPLLQKKIELAKQYQVNIYPGGTMAEIAIAQNQMEKYVQYVKALGFTAVELSEGTIDIEPAIRKAFIEKAHSLDLEVITEYGKKAEGSTFELTKLVDQVEQDLELGVLYVIIEGRESGLGIGIYDANGNVKQALLHHSLYEEKFVQHLLWEAPLKKQQTQLISMFGANVNLGNISSSDTIALEALRRGLRSDTFSRIALQHEH